MIYGKGSFTVERIDQYIREMEDTLETCKANRERLIQMAQVEQNADNPKEETITATLIDSTFAHYRQKAAEKCLEMLLARREQLITLRNTKIN